MKKPEPPKGRLKCDYCGDITETGKHTFILCRFAGWLDRKKKKPDRMQELVDSIIAENDEKSKEIFRYIIDERSKKILKEIEEQERASPFWSNK